MPIKKDDLEPIEPQTALELFLDHKASTCADSTVYNYRFRLKPFVEWCEGTDLDNLNGITGRDVQTYRLWRKETSDLEDENLVKGPQDKKEPASADERIHYLEGKLKKNGKGTGTLLDIDKVQYLYHLYKTDQNTVEYLKEWKSDDLEDLADFMADVTDDDRYESVMEMGLSQF